MSYQVTIEPTGEQIDVEEGQTILQAALRQGVWLPFACGHGTCATCKLQVLEGEVDVGAASPFALMDMERDEGKVLACCAIPQSDLVIEADIDVDPDFAGHAVQDFQATVVALDGRGRTWSSEQLAQRLEHWRGQGRDLAFLIGGPEGHAPEVIARADEQWSLGPLTLPHMLVRLVLAEQLYRATTLVAGHPYHRA